MDGAATRRWRALMTDVQVVLHNHPWNARRAAAGKPPINSLWFWGGGALPDSVAVGAALVWTEDSLVRALASAANVQATTLPAAFVEPTSDVLFDLRNADADHIRNQWLAPTLDAMRRRKIGGIDLDCADGTCLRLFAAQRWRFWRKPRSFVPIAAGDA